MQPEVEGKGADLRLTLPAQRTQALLSEPTVRAVRKPHPHELETHLRRFYYHRIASRECRCNFLQRDQEGMVERLGPRLVRWTEGEGCYRTHRNLCNNAERYPLNVVQQLPLSRGHKRLLGFQEGGIIIPILNVKGNQQKTRRSGDLQPLGQPAQLSVHLLDTPPSLHRLYLGKLRNLLFEHPS